MKPTVVQQNSFLEKSDSGNRASIIIPSYSVAIITRSTMCCALGKACIHHKRKRSHDMDSTAKRNKLAPWGNYIAECKRCSGCIDSPSLNHTYQIGKYDPSVDMNPTANQTLLISGTNLDKEILCAIMSFIQLNFTGSIPNFVLIWQLRLLTFISLMHCSFNWYKNGFSGVTEVMTSRDEMALVSANIVTFCVSLSGVYSSKESVDFAAMEEQGETTCLFIKSTLDDNSLIGHGHTFGFDHKNMAMNVKMDQTRQEAKALTTATFLLHLAESLDASGEFERAFQAYADFTSFCKCIQLTLRVNLKRPVASALKSMATIRQRQKQNAKATLLFKQALHSTEDWDIRANVLMALGKLYVESEEYEEALPVLKEALRIQTMMLSCDDIECAQIYSLVGVCYEQLQNCDKALEYYQEAFHTHDQSHGCSSGNGGCVFLAEMMHSMGKMYFKKREFPSALVLFEQVLHWKRENIGFNTRSIALALNSVGTALALLGRYERAVVAFEEAVSLRTHQVSYIDEREGLASTSVVVKNLATLYLQTDDEWNASKYFRMQVKIEKIRNGPNTSHVTMTLRSIASMFQSRGFYETAIYFFEQAITLERSVPGDNRKHLADTLADLAKLRLLVDENTCEAVSLMAESARLFKDIDRDETLLFSNLPNYTLRKVFPKASAPAA